MRIALVALAACSRGHVELKAPSSLAPYYERNEAYQSLRPAATRIELVDFCHRGGPAVQCPAKIDNESIVLGDGRQVREADDLLPVVDPESKTALHARAAADAEQRQLIGALVGIGIAALGGGIWYSSRSDDVQNIPGSDTGKAAGIGLVTFGTVITLFTAAWFHSEARDEERAAFASYGDDLAARLQVCVDGMAVKACEDVYDKDSDHDDPPTSRP